MIDEGGVSPHQSHQHHNYQRLELYIQITEDGQAVVPHDRRVNGAKCLDTAPAFAGDPDFPYVGKYRASPVLAGQTRYALRDAADTTTQAEG